MILRYFLFQFSILVFIGCSSTKFNRTQNQIIEIGETRSCGDKGGRFHYTRIKKDSTITISGTRWNEKLNDTLNFKTNEAEWNKLIGILNVNDFAKLKPNINGNLNSDGCIKAIYIKTNDSTYAKSGLNFWKSIKEAETINDLIR